jgi:hypothetical protein
MQDEFGSMNPRLRLTDIQALERIAKRATQCAAIRTRESGRAAWGAQDKWLVTTFGDPNDPTVRRVRRLSPVVFADSGDVDQVIRRRAHRDR